MYNPLVSIVIPVYNGSNYLAEAIDSALAQTYKNIEVLVINDGSNDNGATEKIALSYGDKIRYFSKENGGVSSALNLGIDNMKGEWFSWLSHDDLYMPNKIEKQISHINETNKNNTIVICSGILIDIQGKRVLHISKRINKKLTGVKIFKQFLKGYNLNGLGFLIPKLAFSKCGNFDESMRYLQDLDMWLRLMQTDFMFICQKDLLVKSRIHSMQTTNLQKEKFDIDRNELAYKHLNKLSENNFSDFIKLYHFLFLKGNNHIGITNSKNILISNEKYTFNIKLIGKLIYLKGKTIKMLRSIYNYLFINEKRK